ncbi:hypothetical protein TNCV_4505101 [Trichonephila clavipes]|nr:hypothetical protein TNCV_4505101 [Trichonephila clavipes]
MDFSSSDSEAENMDTHIDQRRRTPSPPVTSTAISVLEEDLQHIENASNCSNFLAEMFQLIDNINNYSFDSEEDKSTYHSRLVEICNEGTALSKACDNSKRTTLEILSKDSTKKPANPAPRVPLSSPLKEGRTIEKAHHHHRSQPAKN